MRLRGCEANADAITSVGPGLISAYLRRQGWVLTISIAVSLCLGLAYIAATPAKYRSSARVLIDLRGALSTANEPARTSASADAKLLDVENQRYVMLSRPVLAAAVKRGHLDEAALFKDAPPGVLGRVLALLGWLPARQDREEKAVAMLADMVDVVRGERADVLDVAVTTRDPKAAADIANLVAQVYVEQARDAKIEAARHASEALEERASELGRDVQQAEAAVESYRLQNNLVVTANGQTLDDQQISDRTAQLASAKAATAAAQAKVDQLDHLSKTKIDPAHLPEAMQSAAISNLRGRYAQLAQQEASYVAQFGPKHPSLVEVREQIQDVRNLIAIELARITQSARGELNRAKMNEATLNRSIEQTRLSLGDNSQVFVHLRELERAAGAKKSIYQSILARQRDLEGLPDMDADTTRVIADAVPALKSSGLPLPIVMAGALFVGLGAGAGIGFLRASQAVEGEPEESLEDFFAAPVLGHFSGEPGQSRGTAGARRAAAKADRRTAGAILAHFCRGAEAPVIVGLVGLRSDVRRFAMLAEFVAAAMAQDLSLGIIDFSSGGRPEDDFAEALLRGRRAQRPSRAQREDATVIALSDLLTDAEEPMNLRRLRARLRGYASGKDIVLVDMPAITDVGMPPVLLQTVDHVVLLIAEHDRRPRSLARLADFVAEGNASAAGIVLFGDVDPR